MRSGSLRGGASAGCGAAASEAEPPVERSPARRAPRWRRAAVSAGRPEVSPEAVLELSGGPQSWKASRRRDGRKVAAPSEAQNRSLAFAGVVKRRVTAYRRPGVRALRTFRRMNANDFPTIFGVLAVVHGADCRPAWYRVQLPIRPNGSVGYVRAAAARAWRCGRGSPSTCPSAGSSTTAVGRSSTGSGRRSGRNPRPRRPAATTSTSA